MDSPDQKCRSETTGYPVFSENRCSQKWKFRLIHAKHTTQYTASTVYNQCLSSNLSHFPYLLCLRSHCYIALLCRRSLFSSVNTCTQTHTHLKFVLHGKVELPSHAESTLRRWNTPVFHLLNSCRQTNSPTLESPKHDLRYCPFLLSRAWPCNCVCSTSSQLHFWSVITISNTAVWGLWTGASNCRTREATALCYIQDCAVEWLLHDKK